MSVKKKTLPALLIEKTQNHGDWVAVREKNFGIWAEYTWHQYLIHVKAFCLGIMKIGLTNGDKVSILSENCPEWLFADLGTQSAHGIAVGIYPSNSEDQIEYIVNHSDSKFIVAGDQEQVDKILAIKGKLPKLLKIIVINMKGLRKYDDPLIISFEEVERKGLEEDRQFPDLFRETMESVQFEDVAILVYTSGTTGSPKGAMLTHRSLVEEVAYWQKADPFSENEVMVSFLPLCHVMERNISMIIHLYVGYTINFAESIDSLIECLREISPTFFITVPRITEKMHSQIMIGIDNSIRFKQWMFNFWIKRGEQLAEKKIALKKWKPWDYVLYALGYLCLYRPILDKLGFLRLRTLQVGGASVSPTLIKFFRALGVDCREIYGMTEMGGLMAIQQGQQYIPGSVGKKLPGMQVRVGEDGELFFKGNSLFKGYYKNEEATREVVNDRWLSTGDIGQIDENGNISIIDRKKDILITSGGKNVSPSEIEDHLKYSHYIKEAIVIGEGRKYITAIIQIDMENVGFWAQNNRIAFTTFKNLSRQPAVIELIQQEVEKSNKKFSRVEQVKKFALLDKELDQDDGELTATQKVRRKQINEIYKDLIDSLYA